MLLLRAFAVWLVIIAAETVHGILRTVKPRALISSGFTAPASLPSLPKETGSKLSSGTLTSIHSSFLVSTVARHDCFAASAPVK